MKAPKNRGDVAKAAQIAKPKTPTASNSLKAAPTKAGSRLSQTKADAASRSEEAKRTALKRTVKDKSTGSMVFPAKPYKEWQKAQEVAGQARIETNSTNYAKQQANTIAYRRSGGTGLPKKKK